MGFRTPKRETGYLLFIIMFIGGLVTGDTGYFIAGVVWLIISLIIARE